jgi:hypothetical protein
MRGSTDVRVLILHDVSHGDARFGVRRRLEHLTHYEERQGHSVEIRSIVPEGQEVAGRGARLSAALTAARHFRDAGYDKIVVEALCAPHMVFLAKALVRQRGPAVQLDVCDSPALLRAERSRSLTDGGGLRRTVSLVLSALAYARMPQDMTVSYISCRDAEADGSRGAGTLVIGPKPLPELAAIGPFVGRPTSILTPVDQTTDEGRAALAALARVASEGGLDLPIQITGQPSPDIWTDDAVVEWLGYVPSLTELYDRPCVVVSTNPSDHGVQNKLWEAYQARRPIVAFEQSLHWAPQAPWIHRVTSAEEFGPVLRAALAQRYDTSALERAA